MSLESIRNVRSPEEYFFVRKPATDHDGCMCDLRTHVLDFVNKELQTSYVSDDIRYFNCIYRWALDAGKSEVAALSLEKYVWYDAHFLRKAKPLPGSIELTSWMNDHNINLSIVTSRIPSLINSTYEWYEEHMPWIERKNIFIQPWYNMDGAIFKTHIVKQTGVGFFIEDVPEQAKMIATYTDSQVLLLSDLPELDQVQFNGQVYRSSNGGQKVPDLVEFNRSFLKI